MNAMYLTLFVSIIVKRIVVLYIPNIKKESRTILATI